jgi:hypothetical protein
MKLWVNGEPSGQVMTSPDGSRNPMVTFVDGAGFADVLFSRLKLPRDGEGTRQRNQANSKDAEAYSLAPKATEPSRLLEPALVVGRGLAEFDLLAEALQSANLSESPVR